MSEYAVLLICATPPTPYDESCKFKYRNWTTTCWGKKSLHTLGELLCSVANNELDGLQKFEKFDNHSDMQCNMERRCFVRLVLISDRAI